MANDSQTRLQPQDRVRSESSKSAPAFCEDSFAQNRLSGEFANMRSLTPAEQAYRDGYASGRSHETYNQSYLRQRDRDQARANANMAASGGWLLGISMAAIMGLVGATAYGLYFNPVDNGEPVAPVVASPSEAKPPEPASRVEKQTLVERTVEKLVSPPEIKVNVQSPPVATESVAPAPVVPAPQVSAPAVSTPPEGFTPEAASVPASPSVSEQMSSTHQANPAEPQGIESERNGAIANPID